MNSISNSLPPSRPLEAFVAAAESETFEEAARKLNRSVGTFSLQIKSLEEHVGARLLERGRHKRTELTREGLEYYERARQAIKLLAPHLPGVQKPIISIVDDFEAGLDESEPEFRDFLEAAEKVKFNFTRNEDALSRYLSDRSVTFRLSDGEWRFNHIGRLSPFGQLIGHAFSKKVVGRIANRCIYTGAYNAYDYEVSKVLNLVSRSQQPYLGDVEAMIQLPQNRFEFICYRRLVLLGRMNGEPVIAVRSVLRDSQPMLKMRNTRVFPVEVTHLTHLDPQLGKLLAGWQRARGLWEDPQLGKFRDQLLLVRPLPGPLGSMVIDYIGSDHGSVYLFGRQWQQESRGEVFTDDDLGRDYNAAMEQGYRTALKMGSPQLDLVWTKGVLPSGEAETCVYFRLLLRVVLSDGELAVANMIYRARSLEAAPDAESCMAIISRGDRL